MLMIINANKITICYISCFGKGLVIIYQIPSINALGVKKVVHEISFYYNITHNSYIILNYEQKYLYLHWPINQMKCLIIMSNFELITLTVILI